MDPNSLMFLFIGIAVSAAIFAVLVFFYPQLAERRAPKPAVEPPAPAPAEKTIEQTLAPVLYHAICSAFRICHRAVVEGYPLMSSADKKKIADSMYEVLPDTIDNRPVSEVKSAVSKERFAELVQDAFNAFDKFYKDNQAHMDQQFEAWTKEHPRP